LLSGIRRAEMPAGTIKVNPHPAPRAVLSQTFDFLCARDMSALSGSWQRAVGVIEFKGVHYPKSVILHAVFFYLRYAVSYRDLEEIMAERGVKVDHATLNRWVVKFAPLIAARAQARKRPTATSWRMDETYIRVKGKWTYLYRAVDRDGKTLDFLLSKRRDLSAARRFFKRAIGTNGVPDRIVIDKSGANLAGLQAVNVILKFTGNGRTITVRQVKYLNNILEQDHRFIKRITRPMMGFKAFHSAAATLAGIETAHMIRKGQIAANGATAFQTFAELAA
jgi:putative transposase